MDRAIPHLQNKLTEQSQNVHGSHGSNKFTWHQNITGKGLGKIIVSEISNIMEPNLHACASHHIDKKYKACTPVKMAWWTS